MKEIFITRKLIRFYKIYKIYKILRKYVLQVVGSLMLAQANAVQSLSYWQAEQQSCFVSRESGSTWVLRAS